MAAPRRSIVFCSFEGCDSLARATIGASAFCPLHHSAMMSVLDRGSASTQVESTPVESGDVPERPTQNTTRGTR